MSAWIYCKNMPGYLPDNGPDIIFGDDNARRYVVGELNNDADYYNESGDHDAADQLAGMAEDVNLSGPSGWSDVLSPAEGANWSYSLERVDDETTLEDVAEHRDSFPPHDESNLWELAVEYLIDDDLGTPASAWGPRASDCAPAAAALAWTWWDSSGDVPTLRMLDDTMGLVINDGSGYDIAAQLLDSLHAFSHETGPDADDVVDIVRDVLDGPADAARIILRAGEMYDDETAVSIAQTIAETF